MKKEHHCNTCHDLCIAASSCISLQHRSLMHITAPHTLAIATPTVASDKLVESRTTKHRPFVLHAYTPGRQCRLRSKYIAEESTNSSDPTRSRGPDVSGHLIDHTASPEPPFTQATFWHPLLNMLICASTDASELILDSACLKSHQDPPQVMIQFPARTPPTSPREAPPENRPWGGARCLLGPSQRTVDLVQSAKSKSLYVCVSMIEDFTESPLLATS